MFNCMDHGYKFSHVSFESDQFKFMPVIVHSYRRKKSVFPVLVGMDYFDDFIG